MNNIELSDKLKREILASMEMNQAFSLETFIKYLNKDNYYINVISILEYSDLIKIKNGLINFN